MASNGKKFSERRHRDVNLYFEGYSKRKTLDPKTGRARTEYVYTGDYYIFRTEQKDYNRFRALSVVYVLGAAALYAASNLIGAKGGTATYVGLPALFALIPLLYAVLGLFGLITAKSPKMTIREFTFGVGRLKKSVWAVVGLWGISAVGEVIYIISHRAFQLIEILSLLMQILGIVLLCLQIRQQENLMSDCIHQAESKFETMEGNDKEEGEV